MVHMPPVLLLGVNSGTRLLGVFPDTRLLHAQACSCGNWSSVPARHAKSENMGRTKRTRQLQWAPLAGR